MFENQLKDTIKYLQSIKYDVFQASYYIDLLKNADIQELIKSLLEDDSIENRKRVYLLAVEKSLRAVDLNYLLSIWGNGVKLSEMESEENDEIFDEDNLLILQNEDGIVSQGVFDYFSDVELKSEESVDYQYETIYTVIGNVDEPQQQQFLMCSNLFDLSSIISEANKILKDCIVIEDVNKYRVIADKIDNFNDFMFGRILRPLFIDSSVIKKCYFENSITIDGKVEALEDVALFLRLFLSPLDDYIETERLFVKVREKINKFNDLSKNIKLDRYIADQTIIQKCKEVGIITFRDLLNSVPHNLSIQEALYLSEEILKFDVAMPDQLIKEMLDVLRPREMTIIISRYFYKQTLEDIGSKYCLTRERARQVEAKAIRRLGISIPNRKFNQRVNNIIRLHSKSKAFITQEELTALYLPDNIGIFLEKVLGILVWNSELKVGFFNEDSMKRLFDELEELPSEFTYSDLDDYAGLISLELNGNFSAEEVKYVIVNKYKTYGDFIVKGRLVLKVVLSYLMNMYFPEGFDIYDDEKIELLRKKALEHFDGFELAGNNRAIRTRLQVFCVPIGRGIWKLDTSGVIIPVALKDKILKFINDYQASIIPIQAIMDVFDGELDNIEITNKYHLQGQLKKMLEGVYDVNRDYIIKGDVSSFYEVIADFVKQSKTLVTKHDIMRKFPGVTEIVIQQAATYTKVLNMNGYYVHLDNLNITLDEQMSLKRDIDTVINDTSIYHAKVVFSKVRLSNAGLFSRIGVTHYLQFYYLVKELYSNDYAFNRPFMAMKGVDIISGEAQVLERISAENEVSITRVREFAKEVGTIIDRYIEFVDRNNDTLIFKNHNTLILIEETGIEDADFSSLDSVLTTFIGDLNYRALNEFFDYWKLPELKIKWNEWLLYSIIGKYSEQFKLAVSSNFLQEAVPILVKSEFDEKNIDFSNILSSPIPEDSDEEDLLDVLDYDDLL